MLKSTLMVSFALGLVSFAAPAHAQIKLSGAGSTFVAPFLEKAAVEYQKDHPNVVVDYQAIGSGGGIKAILDKTVAFADSDAPLNKKELEQAATPMMQVPLCAGGIVPIYNLPGVTGDMKLTGEVLASIFMGTITKWNDAKIATLNPDIKLPDLAITPAWRTDGSGSTFVFTSYLALKDPSFAQSIGTGKQVRWPVGQGGKGNPGVAAVVQQTVGAIGYVEDSYATVNKIAFAAVKNSAGKFVRASTNSVSKAGDNAAAAMRGNNLTTAIWEQPGDDVYPIAAFTYVILYGDLRNLKGMQEAQALVNFLIWATHDGQKIATDLGYAPLPATVQTKTNDALRTLTFGGVPVAVAVPPASRK